MEPKFLSGHQELNLKSSFYIEVKGELKSREDYEKADAAADKKIEAVKLSLGI